MTEGFMGWAEKQGNGLTLEDVVSKVAPEPCPICGTKVTRYILDGRQCYWCGGEHLLLTEYGDETCEEYVDGELYIPAQEDGEGCVEWFCTNCRDSFSNHPDGTIIVHTMTGDKFKGQYVSGDGGAVISNWDGYAGEGLDFWELPHELQVAVRSIADSTAWVRTDAWRGYSNPGGGIGFTKLLDGWAGMGGDGKMVSFINSLGDRAVDSVTDFIVVFSTTSNVCSTGVSVYVCNEQVEFVKAAIEAEGVSPYLSTGSGQHAGQIEVIA